MSLHLSLFLSNHLLRFWFSYTLVLLCFLFGQSYLCCHIPWKLGPSLNICFFMHCLTFYMSICLLISYIWNLAIGHFHACPLFHSVTLPWQSAWDSFHQMEFSFLILSFILGGYSPHAFHKFIWILQFCTFYKILLWPLITRPPVY